MGRLPLGFIPVNNVYHEVYHQYGYPPVITLVDVGSGEEIRPERIVHRAGYLHIYLPEGTTHQGLQVWG